MIDLTVTAAEFADERSKAQTEHENTLYGSALYALRHFGSKGWYEPLLDRAAALVRRQYHADTGLWTSPALRKAQRTYRANAAAALKKTVKPEPENIEARARALAASLATAAVNTATEIVGHDDPQEFTKTWVAMHDDRTRPTHRDADGQSVPLGEKFSVGEAELNRPGDMTAPIEEWINCRCEIVLTPVAALAAAAVAPLPQDTDTGVEMADDDTTPEVDEEFPAPAPEDRLDYVDAPTPFWGVLAPENEWSGDHRRFAAGSLRSRPQPLPLAYQKTNEPGHDGSFKVANIERAWRRDDGLVYGSGHFLTVLPEVDEVIGVMAESGGRMGVSVDADDGTMEMVLKDGRTLEEALDQLEPDGEGIDMDDIFTEFSSARICGATLCNIPAFHQAFIALGETPEEFADGEDLLIESLDEQQQAAAASQAVNVAAAGVKTEDGPGWITHPVDTDRLRDWVVRDPKHIFNWGVPGDFNRCRVWAAQYIKPQYLSGYCANRHYDALGFWPGRPTSAETIAAAQEEREAMIAAGAPMSPALTLVDAPDLTRPPKAWFANPNLVEPSAITVTEEGRVFGYAAAWGTCHIGIDGVCTQAPHSASDYAYFKTGYLVTAEGDEVAVGNLTIDTGHADLRARAKPAMAHYDNTGTVWADVTVGEDAIGIWVAGAVRPGLTPERLREIRASALSGDWRWIGPNLEMVAALSVNVQGFPIPRTGMAASGGHQTALVAAGIVLPQEGPVEQLTVEEIVVKTLTVMQEQQAAKAAMAALREEVVSESRAKMNELASAFADSTN